MTLFKRIVNRLYSKDCLVVTNTITGIAFFGAGDLIVQKVIEGRKLNRDSIDQQRVATSCAAGSYMGFVCHHWYTFLDRKFPGTAKSIIKRKLLCEMAIGPPFAASMFLLVGLLEHKTIAQIWNDTKENFHYLIMADWCFYVPLQYLNFYLLKPRFRVLYVAALSLVYDSILVYVLHRNDIQDAKMKKGEILK